MVADFKPSDGSSMSKMEWIHVEGKTTEPAAVAVDHSLEKSVDGKKVRYLLSSAQSGKRADHKVYLNDESTNEPISDLEPV